MYYCKGVVNSETTFVYTPIVSTSSNTDNLWVTPLNEKTSMTASVGESVTVSFKLSTSVIGNVEWRKDGELLNNEGQSSITFNEDRSSITFNSVELVDAGIYELYAQGDRESYRHSFIELIVRGCQAGHWGAPRCTGICDNCYNGGVCDDETGGCICPPGFKGGNCENTCGGNRFGKTCEFRCTYRTEDTKDKCKGHHYCLPHPYGCDCITGYTGLICETDCVPGKFGAGCSQQCNCGSEACNQYTGVCTPGGCASDWTGSNCQVPSICPAGYYGTICTSICHCLNNVECDRSSGLCTNGKCAKGYRTYDVIFCQSCGTGTYGEDCLLSCNCQSASCHHETGCYGGECNVNWLPDSCTTGIISSTNIKVNPGQASTFQCDIEGDLTGVSIQLQIDNDPFDEVDRTESNGITKVSFDALANVGPVYIFYITKDSQTTYFGHSVELFVLPTYIDAPNKVSVTGSSVELTWREWSISEGDSGDGPIVGYIVHYKIKVASDGWSKLPEVNLPPANVTGLNYEEKYSFAVAAVREGDGGEGSRGNKVSISTICGEPSLPVVSTDMSSQKPKQIEISWNSLTNDQLKCSSGVQTYTVSYRPVNSDEKEISVETTNNSTTISELETYTQYTITVTASNKDYGTPSMVTQAFSPEEKPPGPDVTATDEGSYLKVFVNPFDSFGRNLYGNINHYEVRYKSCEKWMNQNITEDDGRDGYKITSVVEEKDYQVGARVVNGAGAGNWSNTATAQLSTYTGTSGDSYLLAVVIILCVLLLAMSPAFIFFCRFYYAHKNKEIVNSTGINMTDYDVKVPDLTTNAPVDAYEVPLSAVGKDVTTPSKLESEERDNSTYEDLHIYMPVDNTYTNLKK